MSDAPEGFDPLEQLKIRLRVVEIMSATSIAFVLRPGNADQRRAMLEELRRNLIVGVEEVHPSTDQAGALATEDCVDRLLDEIVRLAC